MNELSRQKIFLAVGLVVGAILFRFIPHPPNFSPLVSVALFGGFIFGRSLAGILLPISVLFVSDLFLGFYSGWIFVYLGFAAAVLLGQSLAGKFQWLKLGGLILGSSFVFFALSNLGVWLSGFSPMSFEGFVNCYGSALPFYRMSLLGDLTFSIAIFGLYQLISYKLLSTSSV